MTVEHILKLAERYDREIPLRSPPGNLQAVEKLHHAQWVCKNVRELIHAGKLVDAYIALGFIQGVCFTWGVYSQRELDQHRQTW